MNPTAAIHIAKRDLGLDDDTYRDVLERTTGQRSAKGLTAAQRGKVLAEFRRLGWTDQRSSKTLSGPYAGKLQALWIAGWNLGVVRDRRDSAMLAFITRQTGIEHTRFLRDAADARRAIEALKSWLAREGGVDWSDEGLDEDDVGRDPKAKVVWAQFTKLVEIGAFRPFGGTLTSSEIATWAWNSQKISVSGQAWHRWDDASWQAVMNQAGRWLRVALQKRRAA